MNMIKLTLPANIERTPDVDAWLAEAESRINAEALERWHNLAVFGTTHPEARMTACEALARQQTKTYGRG